MNQHYFNDFLLFQKDQDTPTPTYTPKPATLLEANKAAEYIQQEIDTLERGTKKWDIKINTEKIRTMVIGRKTKKEQSTRELTVRGRRTEWKKEAKYLGVLIEKTNLRNNKQGQIQDKLTQLVTPELELEANFT